MMPDDELLCLTVLMFIVGFAMGWWMNLPSVVGCLG